MELNPPHPIAVILSVLAPIVGANFVLKSARDSEIEQDKYPLIDYVVHKEGGSTYEHSKKSWRVELIIQIDYLLQENDVKESLPEAELSESLAVQALQFGLTSKIRSLVQLIVDPGSLGKEFKDQDFIWSKYDFKLVRFIESVYFRKHGMDELTGASSLFVLSLLDVDNLICCIPNNQEQVYAMLDPSSVSGRLLKQKIDNP